MERTAAAHPVVLSAAKDLGSAAHPVVRALTVFRELAPETTPAPYFLMNGFSRVESHGADPFFGTFGATCSFTNRSAASASSSSSTSCKSSSARSSR